MRQQRPGSVKIKSARPQPVPTEADPPPAGDPSIRDFSRSLPMALLRAREAVMNRFRPMLRDYDLTEQQWRVLRALTKYDGIEVTELAARSYILMPSLSRILQFLEARGLISRRPAANDQRRSVISITAEGQALIAEVGPHSEAHYAEIRQAFGEDKMEELYHLLDELLDALNEEGK